MRFSAAQIAAIINATVEGDASVTVASFGKIEEAREGQLAVLANPKYEDYLYTTEASLIIVNESLELKQPLKATLLRVADAYIVLLPLCWTLTSNCVHSSLRAYNRRFILTELP